MGVVGLNVSAEMLRASWFRGYMHRSSECYENCTSCSGKVCIEILSDIVRCREHVEDCSFESLAFVKSTEYAELRPDSARGLVSVESVDSLMPDIDQASDHLLDYRYSFPKSRP